MKTHSSRRQLLRAGFSLVETLMTTSIISTAALSTLGLLAGSMSASQDGHQRSKAMVVAQNLFHDLQLGALNIAPAATDERQTKALRPLTTPIIPRQVFFYSPTGLLADQKRLSKGTLTQGYAKGTSRADVSWIATLEGVSAPAFDQTMGGSSSAIQGQGQVLELPPTDIAPLGDAKYDFATVASAPDPTVAPPATAGALSQVRITVESPASAPQERRKKYSYNFYWNH